VIDHEMNLSLLVAVVGVIIVASILLKSCCRRIGIPALVGYIGLGFLLHLADRRFNFLLAGGRDIFYFLAQLGVIVLLFRIGLESKIKGLIHQLRRASLVWLGNVAVSGFLGWAASYFVLGAGLIPSLFVGIALTATSVGISVGVWREAGALHSPTGELLLDIAELDDISSIVLMAVLFAVVPVLRYGDNGTLFSLVLQEGGILLLKLAIFGTFCMLFSLYIEERLTGFFREIEQAPDPMLMVAGTGFVVAAMAGLLGFSVAIGAFFAGLVFSRDPEAVKLDASFEALYDLFSPFFFVGIGLNLALGSLWSSLGLGSILVATAVVGKVLGTGGPALIGMGWAGGVLLGVSMVPRAEIAMIVMQRGLQLGEWAVPPGLFAGMVMVTAITCIFGPIVVRGLLQRWPQMEEKS